ncbi:LRR receptor-like serine threonine-protein kinase [Seminavis robusta]|uniref:LRR receptor-like serine threonine-protein kinase n=1 Tax=Seminavis robusta TaxID=568900 RepID=A0A9N8EKZ3_9STRA|nr:LRR receptor-like serine threonine-protein kinase [Seminavis robusta]|eukprot:Sro1364_g266460.1 LRR receptor-like serine threonine-protein kinase (741) ;mRNA; f:15723-18308
MDNTDDPKTSDEDHLMLVVASRAEEAARQLAPVNPSPVEQTDKAAEVEAEDDLMNIVAKRAENARQEILADESENLDSSMANETTEYTTEETLDDETPGDEKVEAEDDLMDIVAKRAENARREILLDESENQDSSMANETTEYTTEETLDDEKVLGEGPEQIPEQHVPGMAAPRLVVPLTNPASRQQARAPPSRPGAFALGPNMRNVPTQPDSEQSISSSGDENPLSSDDGLVEARMVEGTPDLEAATPVDPDALEQRNQRIQKQRTKHILVFILILCLAVAIAIGFSIGAKNSSTMTMSPTMYVEHEVYGIEPCDQNGEYHSLFVSGRMYKDKDLLGNIHMPAEIELLTNLRNLHLAFNASISASSLFPSTIFRMAHLRALEYAEWGLVGGIPSELGLMSELKTLNLRYNRLSGTIPTEIRMDSLERLMLSYNLFSASIPTEIGLANKLKSLSIMRSSLVGTLPSELGLLTGLTALKLNENQYLSGSIPTEIGLLSHLEELRLYYTDLTGRIPTEFGALNQMTRLMAFRNSLSGALPSQLGVMVNLHTLSMEENRFTGTVPSELGLLRNWSSFFSRFFLHDNALTGTLPTELGLMTNVTEFRIEKNSLSGQIPSELASLSRLSNLYFSHNNFSGSVPSEYGLFGNLERLQLEELPLLSNSLPTELSMVTTLGVLNISGTGIEGIIPPGLCHFQNSSCSFGSDPNLVLIFPDLFRCHLVFECTDSLCGCDCPCLEENGET